MEAILGIRVSDAGKDISGDQDFTPEKSTSALRLPTKPEGSGGNDT
jgi:hypothetical protein